MNYYPMYQPYAQYGQYQNQQQQQTVQSPLSGNIIPVQNEDEARMYPIAPGNSVTFKDENQPYIYTKTMGFSQLDRPVFEKYKLIKEEQVVKPTNIPKDEFVLKSDFSDLINKVADLEDEILTIRGENKSTKRTAKGDAGNAER